MITCGYCETQNNTDNQLCTSCHGPMNDEITRKRNKTKGATTFYHNIIVSEKNIHPLANFGISVEEAGKLLGMLFR